MYMYIRMQYIVRIPVLLLLAGLVMKAVDTCVKDCMAMKHFYL